MMRLRRTMYSTTLGKVRQEGLLDGRVKFHHTTKTENVPSIHEKGLLTNRSLDKDNWTNKISGIKTDKGIIYLAKDRRTNVKMKKSMEKRGFGPASILDLSIPFEDYSKLEKSPNPNLLGCKSYEEWKRKFAKEKGLDPKNNPKDRKRLITAWKNIVEGTETIGEDISPNYIRSSEIYKKNSAKEIAKYIKDNPKRFIKGLGKFTVGLVKYPFEYKKDAKYYE